MAGLFDNWAGLRALMQPRLVGTGNYMTGDTANGPRTGEIMQPADPMGGNIMQRLQYLRQNSPETLMALGAGVAQGNAAGGFADAGKYLALHRKQATEKAEKTRTSTLTKNYLMKKHGMTAEDAEAIIAGGGASQYMKPANATDDFKVVGDQIFKTSDQSWITPPGGGAPETGLVPVMVRNPETGETIYVQPTRDGRLLPSQVPEGFEPYDPYSKAAATASGKGEGEALVTWKSMSSKMPGVEFVVKELDVLADKATYTYAGQAIDAGMRQAGMEPRDAAVARSEYIAKVDNQILPMLRDVFGAQFTQKEGESLKVTLGDPNKSPKEKQAVLKAFIEQKRRNIEALAVEAGQQPGGDGMEDPLGLRN